MARTWPSSQTSSTVPMASKPASFAGDSLAHGVGVDVGDHDARAFARQRQGRGVADAAAGSGDDGDFAGELQIHVSVPFSWPRGGLAASASAVLIIRDAE